ncbi:hypothetical protein [Mucilaginibacter ginsenosidivorax]|uniref:Uncharacterized protein n=1 Tax=Mucilaginibacter ginsenosidivorax TaxID=862126 RepID=A0A5B8W702_9SPHI|nr:hypothetical protein [Mucilaginibacter ginsenosidivorax]QEC78696.1 hypothetical protein FSB76_23115 [Mucilaginibacter ginsenosidivorax]
MNNKKFGLLLSVVNVLSVVTFEKYWKRGFKITFKKNQVQAAAASAPVVPISSVSASPVKSPLSIVA